MAGTRTVYRGSRGRFAGASNGKAEKVRSGGFANAAFRARVASGGPKQANAARPTGSQRQHRLSDKTKRRLGEAAVAGTVYAAAGRSGRRGIRQGVVVYAAAKGLQKAGRSVKKKLR